MNAREFGAGAILILALCACATAPETVPEAESETPAVVTAPEVPKQPTVSAPAPAARTPPPRIAESKSSELEMLLAEFERLRRLPPAELAREQELARTSYMQSKSDAARVKWAMSSSGPGAAPADELRALELLDPLVKNPASPLHGLAFVLSAAIQEQRRLASLVQGLQQNLQGLHQNNQALQQSVHGLQQKLDALRTLERSLTERGESAPRRR